MKILKCILFTILILSQGILLAANNDDDSVATAIEQGNTKLIDKLLANEETHTSNKSVIAALSQGNATLVSRILERKSTSFYNEGEVGYDDESSLEEIIMLAMRKNSPTSVVKRLIEFADSSNPIHDYTSKEIISWASANGYQELAVLANDKEKQCAYERTRDGVLVGAGFVGLVAALTGVFTVLGTHF